VLAMVSKEYSGIDNDYRNGEGIDPIPNFLHAISLRHRLTNRDAL
jgi:hypothetical protein